MLYISLLIAAIISFFVHDLAEKFFVKRNKKINLIVRGLHIHHSSFGLAVIILGLFITSGIYLWICFGYGIGNIWQHKVTHNRSNENGMVFVTKIDKSV